MYVIWFEACERMDTIEEKWQDWKWKIHFFCWYGEIDILLFFLDANKIVTIFQLGLG